MRVEKRVLVSKVDGLKLGMTIVFPETTPLGIVQICHGMAEHRNRYFDFMTFLADHGFIVCIHDHRGHGESLLAPSGYGYFGPMGSLALVEDAHQVTEYLKERFNNLPFTLFGHSMGSLVARAYLKNYDQELDKLILMGAPYHRRGTSFGLFYTKLVSFWRGDHYRSQILQHLTFSACNKSFKEPYPNRFICSNPTVVEKYNEDSQCGFIFTLNGFASLFQLIDQVYEEDTYGKKNLSLPILFLLGEKDPIIGNKKQQQEMITMLKNMGYSFTNVVMYPECRHELLNEWNKEVVYQDILNYLTEKEKPL